MEMRPGGESKLNSLLKQHLNLILQKQKQKLPYHFLILIKTY